MNRASRMHAVGRLGSGFDLSAVVAEYRALRASVIPLWRESGPGSGPPRRGRSNPVQRVHGDNAWVLIYPPNYPNDPERRVVLSGPEGLFPGGPFPPLTGPASLYVSTYEPQSPSFNTLFLASAVGAQDATASYLYRMAINREGGGLSGAVSATNPLTANGANFMQGGMGHAVAIAERFEADPATNRLCVIGFGSPHIEPDDGEFPAGNELFTVPVLAMVEPQASSGSSVTAQQIACPNSGGVSDLLALPVSAAFGGGGLIAPDCPGDLDGDNGVALDDLAVLLSHFGMCGAAIPDGDADGDSDVDLQDLAVLLSHFGDGC